MTMKSPRVRRKYKAFFYVGTLSNELAVTEEVGTRKKDEMGQER